MPVLSRIVLIGSLLFSGMISAAENKVGVIDYQKLIVEIPFQQIMAEKMKSAIEQERQDIQALYAQIKTKQKSLDDNKETLTPEKIDTVKKEINTLRQAASKKQTDMRKQSMERQNDLRIEIQSQIQDIAKKVALEKGLSRVFRADSLIWDDNKLDITDEVVKHFNTVYKVTPEMKAKKPQMPLGLPQR